MLPNLRSCWTSTGSGGGTEGYTASSPDPALTWGAVRGGRRYPIFLCCLSGLHACFPCVGLPTAPKSAVLEEMLHNLDFCDILVLGGDLDPRQECLELNHSELHQRHLDATNSTAGYSIYGKPRSAPSPGGLLLQWPRPGRHFIPMMVGALDLRAWAPAPSFVSYSSILRTWTTSPLLGDSPAETDIIATFGKLQPHIMVRAHCLWKSCGAISLAP